MNKITFLIVLCISSSNLLANFSTQNYCDNLLHEQSFKQYNNLGQHILELTEDKLNVEKDSRTSETTADKWYARGNIELALKFDIQNAHSTSIYGLWGAIDDGSIWCITQASSRAQSIANKWYQRNEPEIASEFLKISIEHLNRLRKFSIIELSYPINNPLFYCSELIKNISDLSYSLAMKDSIPEAFLIMAKNMVSLAHTVLDQLVKHNSFHLIEPFANEVLTHWVSNNFYNINDQLSFAVKTNSETFYEILENKLLENPKSDWLSKGYKCTNSVQPELASIESSISNYLANKMYIDLEFLNHSSKSPRIVCKDIENSLSELAKKDGIVSSILHAIALHAKENPNFKFKGFYENNQTLEEEPTRTVGAYSSEMKYCTINIDRLTFLQQGTLIHEWCHQLMDILYENDCKPYSIDNLEAKDEYQKAIKLVQKRLNKIQENNSFKVYILNQFAYYTGQIYDDLLYEHLLTIISSVVSLYDTSKHEIEFIVRLPQIIANVGGPITDLRLDLILEPLYDYWMKYTAPDIEKYIRDRAHLDNFILENVSHPLRDEDDEDL